MILVTHQRADATYQPVPKPHRSTLSQRAIIRLAHDLGKNKVLKPPTSEPENDEHILFQNKTSNKQAAIPEYELEQRKSPPGISGSAD